MRQTVYPIEGYSNTDNVKDANVQSELGGLNAVSNDYLDKSNARTKSDEERKSEQAGNPQASQIGQADLETSRAQPSHNTPEKQFDTEIIQQIAHSWIESCLQRKEKIDAHALVAEADAYICNQLSVAKYDNQGQITPEFQKASRQFFVECMNVIQNGVKSADEQASQKLVSLIRDIAPVLNQYSQETYLQYLGFEELMSTASDSAIDPDRDKANRHETISELNYRLNDLAFDSSEALLEYFRGKTWHEMMNAIDFIGGIGAEAETESSWSEKSFNAVTTVLDTLARDDRLPAMVRIVAYQKLTFLLANWDFDEYDETPPQWLGQELYARDMYIHDQYKQGQEIAKNLNIDLTQTNNVVMPAAKNAVAESNMFLIPQRFGITRERVFSNNNEVVEWIDADQILNSQLNPFNRELPHDSDHSSEYIRWMQTPEIKYLMERYIGVRLDQVSIKSQIYLLKFLSQATMDQLNRMREAMTKLGTNQAEFLESFLALEMGDEFGDILPEIVETLPAEQTADVLNQVQAIRQSAQKLGEVLSGSEKQFTEYGRAINLALIKRTTEILSILPPLAKGEKVPAVSQHRYEFGRVELNQVEYPLVALRVLRASLDKITQEMSQTPTEARPNPQDPSITNIKYDQCRLSIRPRQSQSGEARINFNVQFSQQEYTDLGCAFPNEKVSASRRRLSLRGDLEDLKDAPPQLSFDLGTSEVKDPDNLRELDLLIGIVTTAGAQEIAHRRMQPIENQNNHVREAFSPHLAQPQQYAAFLENVLQEVQPSA